ncbi:MAG: T9SS type A sorting domain-containing protein [Rhodothermaceae bacterium]|nr:T9SS type A sorting domain-containing protein [Rhodothermaceae bacterium]
MLKLLENISRIGSVEMLVSRGAPFLSLVRMRRIFVFLAILSFTHTALGNPVETIAISKNLDGPVADPPVICSSHFRSFPLNFALFSGTPTCSSENEADGPDMVTTISDGDTPPAFTIDSTSNSAGPKPPTNLTATTRGATVIELSWYSPVIGPVTGPDENVEYLVDPSITGYRIEVSSTGAEGPWTTMVANTKSSARFHNLIFAPETTRYFRISAFNEYGESDPSNVAEATTTAPSVPDSPIDFRSEASPFTIRLSWKPPLETGGAAITGYRIQFSPHVSIGLADATESWSDLANLGPTTTTYTERNLEPLTGRNYRIFTINRLGESKPVHTQNVTIEAATPTVPNPPTELNAEWNSQESGIGLTWRHTTYNGGLDLTGYRIEVSSNAGTSWSHLKELAPEQNTFLHFGLPINTTYFYRIRALNVRGPSRPSNVATATTGTTTTVTPPSSPTDLTASPSGSDAIILRWAEPSNTGGAAITGYRIQVSPDGNTGWTNLYSGLSTTYTHRGLTAGTTRHYRVYASNGTESESIASNVVTATTTAAISPPDAPTGLTASTSSPSTIILSWTEPSNTGGSAITGYRIQVSPEEETGWSDLHTGTSTNYTHSGLTAGTTRYYRVYASNEFGESGSSNTANATTSAATEPTAPTSLIAEPFGTTAIKLSWSAPLESGGSPITGYRIEVSADGTTGSWSDLQTSAIETTAYTHEGLRAATTRHYRVYAMNAIGESDASGVVSATTEGIGLQFAGETGSHTYTMNTVIPWYVLPEAHGGMPPYAYTLTPALPEGLDFDASMRTVSGTPTTAMSATNYIYRVTDAEGTAVYLMFTIEIVEAVVLKGMIHDQYLARGQLMDPLMFTDASGGVAPIVYELTPGLPEGLIFNEQTRALSGTPMMVTQAPIHLKYSATDTNGSSDSLTFTIEIFSPVAIENTVLPRSFTVHGNYPNPFNPSTRIQFDLPENALVILQVMDVLGRELMRLPVKEFDAGYSHGIDLNTTNLASGNYLYRVIATGSNGLYAKTGHMTLVK